MLDQFNSALTLLPVVSFLLGLGGSLHCLAMCGGLVTATTKNQKEIFLYQIGRLISYSLIALLSGSLSKLILSQLKNPMLAIIPSLLIGGLFIYWGLKQLLGDFKEIPTPSFLKTAYQLFWKRFIVHIQDSWRGFFVGLISIFLPCGLLYGATLGLANAEHPGKAVFAMFFFWLGTLPSMILFPKIFQNLMSPIKAKMPKFLGLVVLCFGLLTIGYRLYHFEKKSNDYELKIKKGENLLSPSKNICH